MAIIERVMAGRYSKWLALTLFALPAIYFWIYCVFVNPFRNYFTRDTEFQYFLNSLAVFKGAPYVYVDHPGTPLEVIGSLILGGMSLALRLEPRALIDFSLRNPGAFLDIAHYFMIITHVLTMCVFFLVVRRSSGIRDTIMAAALASTYFAIHVYSLRGSVLWNHNAFAFPFGTLLLLGLYRLICKPGAPAELKVRAVIALGVGAGMLAAITIYLIAWTFGILVAIIVYYALQDVGWKKILQAAALFLVSSTAGFWLAVAPVWGRMRAFWAWTLGILSHRGSYLAVPEGESFFDRVPRNLIRLFELLPTLSIVVLLLAALTILAFILFRRRLGEQPGAWALLAGALVQILALVLAFLDRPLREYYFLSVAATVPIAALALVRIYEASPSISRVCNWGVSVLVFVGLVTASVQNIGIKREEMANLATTNVLVPQLIEEAAARLQRPAEDLTILWMNGSYSTCWALLSGDHRAGDVFDSEIGRICPRQYEFGQRVLLPGEKVPLEQARWDILFTCRKYLDDVLAKEPAVGVVNYPSITWNCGEMAVVYNR